MGTDAKEQLCGIVMPISEMGDCSAEHWSDVLTILMESISDAKFKGELVSQSDDSGIIHKTIIQNLYENPIVVCDVSGKNPNVMFELGMRLAFDKPTIIVKDNVTAYSFDTSSIEHLEYPRDLRFSKIIEFKKKLTDKIVATYKKSTTDANYTTFLKHFGEFTVAKIDQKEVSGQEFIIEELKNMRRSISILGRKQNYNNDFDDPITKYDDSHIDICLLGVTEKLRDEATEFLHNSPEITRFAVRDRGRGHVHLTASVKNPSECDELESAIRKIISRPRRPRHKRKRPES